MPMNYDLVPLPPPVGGLDLRTEPVVMDATKAVRLRNMIVTPTKIRKRRGYSRIGNNLPLVGDGMDLIRFVDGDAAVHTLAVTSRFIYEYDSDVNEWKMRNDGIQLHTCEDDWDNDGDGEVTVSDDTTYYKQGSKSQKFVLSTTGVADDGVIAVTSDISPVLDLTDANGDRSVDLNSISFWLRSTVALASGDLTLRISHESDAGVGGVYEDIATDVAVVADTWTFVEVTTAQSTLSAVKSLGLVNTSGGTLSSVSLYLDDIWARYAFTGTPVRWSHKVLNDAGTPPGWNRATAIGLSNNIDLPVAWDGSDANFSEYDTGIANFATVKEISQHNNHVMLYNFADASAYKRSVKFADIGDTDDYSGGTSGEEILTEAEGELLRCLPLKNYFTIYTERSIIDQFYIGGLSIFAFNTVMHNVGLIGERAIWSSSFIHYFIGSDQKFYAYTGGA
ncbi:MAG: hypothetical protein ACXABY_27180, partial [Candidatus Thorarchaeota archaeon]